jgi:Uma2 family endonuclease
MPSGTLISVEEYLHHTYRPDCDYIDGEVQERNLGELEHSSAQGQIVHYLKVRYPHLLWKILPEQRVRIAATRYRIPDVCVLAANAPREKVIATPPILCIEILSSEDRMKRILERIADYSSIGVPVSWIIDPVRRKAWSVSAGEPVSAEDGVLRAGEIEMPLAEVLEPVE